MSKFFALSWILLIHHGLLAQKTLPEPGKIELADLQLKTCPFEPSADAMTFFDLQEVEFEPRDYSSILRTERRVRIKIFNEKGYPSASISIPYFSKKKETKIRSLTGVVYNLDASGKITIQKLDKKDFFKEKGEDNLGMIHFTFPNLKPGSVVEFSYTKIEKNILQIDPWIVQADIPVAYAARSVIIPEFSRLKEKVFGSDTMERSTEKLRFERNKTTFFKENIKSFQPEPFMSSYRDNLIKVIFLLIPRSSFFTDALMAPKTIWKYVGNVLLDASYFGAQVKKQIPGTEKIIDSAKNIRLFQNKIAFIYDTVKKRFPDKGEQTLYPNDLVEAWNNKSGNSAEINLVLLNLLEKSNVQCYPILISTREHGKVNRDFPSLGQLNGVDVLAVDSNKYYLLDASLKFQSCKNPPFNVLNRQGLLLAKDNMQWVSIDDDRPLVKQNINIVTHMGGDGKISGSAWLYYFDYAKSFALDTTSDDEEQDRFFDKGPMGLKILSVKQENRVDSEPLIKEIEFEYEPPATNEYYFLSPQFMADKKENPFTQSTRTTDIDFGSNQQLSLKFQLDLSDTFQVDHLPKNIMVRAPDSSFLYKRTYSASRDSTVIFFQQVFEIKRPVFDKEEYSGIQEFFNLIFPLMAEEIVLKKRK
jgi:hypothetical protein